MRITTMTSKELHGIKVRIKLWEPVDLNDELHHAQKVHQTCWGPRLSHPQPQHKCRAVVWILVTHRKLALCPPFLEVVVIPDEETEQVKGFLPDAAMAV